MLALVFATERECSAVLPGGPVPDEGGWAVGEAFGREAAVLVTGVGPLNAALGLGRLLEALPPVDAVVNMGVAGSFDVRALPLGAVAVAGGEVWPEYGLRTEGGVDAKGIGFALATGPGGAVYERIGLDPARSAREMGLCLDAGWAVAQCATVSAASGDAATARGVAVRLGGDAPGLENMEGFALALGCLRAELPFLELRAVSNVVGSRGKADWDLPGALAALAAAARTLLTTEEQS
jgi:futalosine hydrolase